METLLRNSSYILRFRSVLPCVRKQTGDGGCSRLRLSADASKGARRLWTLRRRRWEHSVSPEPLDGPGRVSCHRARHLLPKTKNHEGHGSPGTFHLLLRDQGPRSDQWDTNGHRVGHRDTPSNGESALLSPSGGRDSEVMAGAPAARAGMGQRAPRPQGPARPCTELPGCVSHWGLECLLHPARQPTSVTAPRPHVVVGTFVWSGPVAN